MHSTSWTSFLLDLDVFHTNFVAASLCCSLDYHEKQHDDNIINRSNHIDSTFYLQLIMSDKDKPLGSPTAQVRIGHYILGDTLGVGTFGKVTL